MIKTKFVEEIESICKNKKIEYIDAIIMWCEENNVEIETVASWIKKEPTIKYKVQIEAEDLNFIKRGATLPV